MRHVPAWPCLLVTLSIAAVAPAEESPGNDALVDRLLGDDVGASREAACHMAHRGKEAMAVLDSLRAET
jgi:hypothetical protein